MPAITINYVAVALIILMAIVVWAITQEVIKFLFRKLVLRDKEYRTVSDCEHCRMDQRNDAAGMNNFKADMRKQLGLIRTVLLMMATKQDLSPDLIEQLMKA